MDKFENFNPRNAKRNQSGHRFVRVRLTYSSGNVFCVEVSSGSGPRNAWPASRANPVAWAGTALTVCWSDCAANLGWSSPYPVPSRPALEA